MYGKELYLRKGSATKWRTRAKLCVRSSPQNTHSIGLFEKDTHTAMDIPHCQVHHPRINTAVQKIRKKLHEENLSAYNEGSHQGDLRYLQFIIETKSNTVQVSFVLNLDEENTAKFARWKLICNNLITEEPEFWHSTWINLQPKRTNTIFGSTWLHINGKKYIWERLAGLEIPFGPSHFGQANLMMFEELITDLKGWIPINLNIAELYGGIGIIGLSLARDAKSVIITEIEPTSISYFNNACDHLPSHIQQKIEYKTCSAEKSIDLLKEAEVVVVDPPRKGVEDKLLNSLLKLPRLRYLAYISCQWSSLERDMQKIIQESGWALDRVQAYLFFPGTNHIETLAIFKKEQ
jgi:23S rRNA (uracil1939-C5)-methyltransferase